MEQDYDIGSTIRDKIIPHVVSWFKGEVVQGDEFDDIEGDENEYNEDVDEDDDDEEDIAAKNMRKKVYARRNVKRGVPHEVGQERPPKCKQQQRQWFRWG
ncbi:nucleosome assembly protein 1;3-like [Aristolochia californica]|uniref:nucleosome assembly protein 1;3-like n=1 Tax=Aristolochia californica TaxID=171875 RepID=UPI0035D8981D